MWELEQSGRVIAGFGRERSEILQDLEDICRDLGAERRQAERSTRRARQLRKFEIDAAKRQVQLDQMLEQLMAEDLESEQQNRWHGGCWVCTADLLTSD